MCIFESPTMDEQDCEGSGRVTTEITEQLGEQPANRMEAAKRQRTESFFDLGSLKYAPLSEWLA